MSAACHAHMLIDPKSGFKATKTLTLVQCAMLHYAFHQLIHYLALMYEPVLPVAAKHPQSTYAFST